MKRPNLKLFLLLAALFLIPIIACTGGNGKYQAPEMKDVSASVNSMQEIYARVYNGSAQAWTNTNAYAPWLWGIFWFIFLTFVLGIGIIFFAQGFSKAGALTSPIIALVIAVMVGNNMSVSLYGDWHEKADKQAVHGMTSGKEAAQYNKANQYVENLIVPLVGVTREWRNCDEVDNSSNTCGSYVPEWTYDHNYQKHCSTSKDSNGHETESCYETHDTMHVPFIKKIARQIVYVALRDDLATPETGLQKSDRKDMPKRVMTDWQIPWDYEWYQAGRTTSLAGYNMSKNPQWAYFYDRLYVKKVPTTIFVYHVYVNWIFTGDAEALVAKSASLKRYQDAGMLPTMAQIYSRNNMPWKTDLDCVQFVGGLKVQAEKAAEWQQQCGLFGNYAGNDRQVSVTIIFAPADKVTSLGEYDEWADAGKANYSDKTKWTMTLDGESRFQMLQKNAVLIFCGVDEKTQQVVECRLRTGMPKGNELLIEQIASKLTPEMNNVPFVPISFFGQNVTLKKVDDVIYTPQLTFSVKSVISLLMRPKDAGGVSRTKMGDYQWLQASIVLDPAEIDRLVNDEVGVQKALADKYLSDAQWSLGILILAIIVVFGLLVVAAFNR